MQSYNQENTNNIVFPKWNEMQQASDREKLQASGRAAMAPAVPEIERLEKTTALAHHNSRDNDNNNQSSKDRDNLVGLTLEATSAPKSNLGDDNNNEDDMSTLTPSAHPTLVRLRSDELLLQQIRFAAEGTITIPALVKVMLAGASGFLTHGPTAQLEAKDYNPSFAELIEDQNRIGWGCFLEGNLSQGWMWWQGKYNGVSDPQGTKWEKEFKDSLALNYNCWKTTNMNQKQAPSAALNHEMNWYGYEA